MAEWCREQGVNNHQMYYWIRNFEDDVASDKESDTKWLTVNVEDKPKGHTGQEPVFIHFGTISVEVRTGTNMALLSDVVHVLQNQ